MNHLPYYAAISADSAFSAELQRAYGRNACNRRYQTAAHDDQIVETARRQFNQAMDAWHRLCGARVQS